MQFQRLSFTNSQGVKLAARLDLPLDEKPAAFAIFAHCFTCTKNFNAVVNIDRALAREGIAVLRFDFTGLGESEGQFAETNLSTNISDIVSAAEFLGSHYEAPQLLIGHSLGGAAILQAASQIPSATAVATIAAPFDLTHIASFFEDNWRDIETKGEAEVNLAGKKFNIRKQFIENLERTHMEETIRSLKKALVVFHSPADEIVSIDNAAKIFQAARHPKSFISLDKSDHLLSNRSDSIYTGMVLAAWVRKYIDLPRKDQQGRDLHDNRIVVRTGRHGYRTEITANGHSLIADEPIAVGGADTGPTPYDYLVAALGACTSMTLRMYADRKAWPLESIVVRLRHRKIHSDDCQDCESRAGSMDLIEREIELDGPLDKGQRERLLDIADKCPVHRTLHSGVRVKSWLKDQNIGGSSENY
jgi:putative redox protein